MWIQGFGGWEVGVHVRNRRLDRLGRPVSRERSVLKKMNQAMACRGPDDEGVWLSKHAALVHRRLVVIDPEEERSRWFAATAAGPM